MSESTFVWKVPAGDLTDRQIAIMGCIKDHVEAHGWAPTLREIGRAVGINSTSIVAYNLRRLAQRGYIELGQGARTIKLVTR